MIIQHRHAPKKREKGKKITVGRMDMKEGEEAEAEAMARRWKQEGEPFIDKRSELCVSALLCKFYVM